MPTSKKKNFNAEIGNLAYLSPREGMSSPPTASSIEEVGQQKKWTKWRENQIQIQG